MTAPGGTDPGGYPAPGSATPGAPPPLKRALTPADGVLEPSVSGGPDRDSAGSAVQRPTTATPSRLGPGLVAAAAMFGVAAGLEIAGVLARPRRR